MQEDLLQALVQISELHLLGTSLLWLRIIKVLPTHQRHQYTQAGPDVQLAMLQSAMVRWYLNRNLELQASDLLSVGTDPASFSRVYRLIDRVMAGCGKSPVRITCMLHDLTLSTVSSSLLLATTVRSLLRLQ
jgi:hypothetical protein